MANTFTTNYAWTKPEVGADTNAWGTHLNADLDSIDATLSAVSAVADAAMPTTGGAFTGTVSIIDSAPALILSAPAGDDRGIFFRTSANARWVISADGSTESGGNVGSNLLFTRFNDAGSGIDAPLVINRATGFVTLADGLTVDGPITATGLIQAAASGSSGAGLNLAVGTAPTTPNNGDIWPTTSGLFFHAGGVTQQVASVSGLGLGALAFLETPTFVSPGAFQAGQDLTAPLTTPTATEVGYMGAPINSQSGDYTLALTDRGKEVFFTGSATCTIPSNASVPFVSGNGGMLISADVGVTVTIVITSDTLRLVPSNATGSRTLVGPATAFISKKKTTEWWIKGDVA